MFLHESIKIEKKIIQKFSKTFFFFFVDFTNLAKKSTSGTLQNTSPALNTRPIAFKLPLLCLRDFRVKFSTNLRFYTLHFRVTVSVVFPVSNTSFLFLIIIYELRD